nr:CD151 antigen-like [Pocillopora verrucosa]
MAQGGMVLVKYLLFIFNFIFWISGICLIAVGAWIKAKYRDFIQLSDSSSAASGAVFLIIIGVIVAIVGFLGCCGAWKENYCMVTTYAILLAIIFILEIAAGAVAYAYKGKLEDYTKKALDDGIDKYLDGDKDAIKAIDNIQKQFKCCGVDGYENYLNASDDKKFPKTCCKNEKHCPGTVGDVKKLNGTKLDDEIYTKGCLKQFEQFLHDHILIVGGVGIGIAFVQLIGILFACCLMRSIKAEYEVV